MSLKKSSRGKNVSKALRNSEVKLRTSITRETASEFLKVTWKVYRVSPIYNFQVNRLKIYARKFKEELAAAYYGTEILDFDCDLSLKEMKLNVVYNTIDINVKIGQKMYVGHFISSPNDQAKEEYSTLKHFPLLLVRSGEKISKQVHNIFSKFFDCDICPVYFAFDSLISFFGTVSEIYVKDVSDHSSEIVSLNYKIPGNNTSDVISISLSLAATSTTWAVLNHEYGHQTIKQLIPLFYDKIVNHIWNVFRINLSPTRLVKIVFPHFTISDEGWIKFNNKEIFDEVLFLMHNFI